MCNHCGGKSPLVFISPLDGEKLCRQCAQREIQGLLEGLDSPEITILRRRAEDCIRKNPDARLKVLISLILEGNIQFLDVI